MDLHRQHAAPTRPKRGIVDALTAAERDPPRLAADAPLTAAIEAFETQIDLRLMPVVDADDRLIGALMERDIRKLLLNPYGHALMRNPAYGNSLAGYIRPCPVADAALDIGRIMDAYRSANGSEGMVLTREGKVFAVIANRRLVHFAAERDADAVQRRLARAQRIEQASDRFEAQVAHLTNALQQLSARVERNATETADRAGIAGQSALGVASAATQTTASMGAIAQEGRALADALGRIGRSTLAAEAAAASTVALVTAGSARAADLKRSAESVDTVIALIGEIARKVNLLALNATIEAARAGDAGRGFTVVANEVKSLSMQTAVAARRITGDIDEIRRAIDEVADGHSQVELAIGAIATQSHEIQAAVGVQEAATNGIARNVEDVLAASSGIQHDVEAIGGSARAASASANDLTAFSQRMLDGARQLSAEVGAFVAEVRAA